jgi:hypothetical protein
MRFPPVHLAARWFASAAFGALAVGAPAQQKIEFSKPADQDPTAKANALAPTFPHQLSASAFNAPSPLFGDRMPTADFDVSPAYFNQNAGAGDAAKWKKNFDSKKNWMLMTPEEILNIPTPENVMGVGDLQDEKLSPEERFMQRQNRLAAGDPNDSRRADASPWRDEPVGADPFHAGDANTRFAETLGGSIPGAVKNPNALADLNQFNQFNHKSSSTWASPFNQQEPLPKQTPDQLAGMERFRALMESQTPEKAPEAARFSYPSAAAPDPNMQVLPAYNPAGRSFTRLENGMNKPTGIMPLPGLNGQRPTPLKKEAPLVQPPPWLSTSPQSLPQREF